MIMCLPKLECKGKPYLPFPRTVQEVKAWCPLCEGPVSTLAGCVLPAGLGTHSPSQRPRPTPACLFPRGQRRWLLVQSWPDARDEDERSFPVASDVPVSPLDPTSKCRKYSGDGDSCAALTRKLTPVTAFHSFSPPWSIFILFHRIYNFWITKLCSSLF